jgi:hypothetical protein
MLRLSVFFLAATLTGVNISAGTSAIADTRYAQYYPPHYSYPPPGYRPPCNAVTPGLFRVRHAARLEAPLLAQSRVMPGAARQSGPASALSAVRYVKARPAARAPVTEATIAVP